MKVIIVGAGFGGLSLAALLAREGHQVTVFEKNSQYGGRARIHKDKGFQFDMGPSWYLMPKVFENFFKQFGKKPEDFYSLKRIDPSYRIFFNRGNVIDVGSSYQKIEELFNSLESNGAEKLKEYLALAKEKYDLTMDETIYRGFESITDFFSWELLKNGPRLGVFSSLDSLVKKYFKSQEAQKIFEYSMGFLGGSPKMTPAMYQIMSYVDMIQGVWFPVGGMVKVADAIYQLAISNKVQFYFDEEVKKIEVENDKAKKVITDKRQLTTDAIIVNADYAHAELNLLEAKYQSYGRKYWDSRILAPSAFVTYIGINKKIKKLMHHSLFLEKDWASNFEEIFNNRNNSWPTDPSYYVNVPSKTDPKLAPKNCETLFILAPLSPGLKDTNKEREKFLNQIVTHLEKTVGEQIKEHIVTKRIFAVNDFAKDYNAYKGTALGLAHTFWQSAYFRPHHQSKKVKNLYYSGQYTHPGIGVPMTLISSQITAKIITNHKKWQE